MIDFEVNGDHELFDSPDDFVKNVSPEARRSFQKASIVATGDTVRARVVFSWNRPWWRPGVGPDADVLLAVQGPNQDSVHAAFEAIGLALRRGGTHESDRWDVQLMWLLWALFVGGVVSTLYLIGITGYALVFAALGAILAGFVLAATVGTWICPPLEIAVGGQTRIRRVAALAVPIVTGLMLAALSKLIG